VQFALTAPTITDRVAQMAVKLLVEPGIDAIFHSSSFGYRNEQFRNEAAPSARHIWDGMATLAQSGILERQAATDIEGIPLRRVFVNLLLTKRFRPCVDFNEMVEKPARVTPVFRQGIVY